VKAFTNRDIVGLRIWLTPPLPDPPYRHLAPRSFASSGNGRCNALCLIPGACIHTSHSSGVVKITGIAFGWIGSTIAFGAVVRKP
jgi:hypothetical protein